MQAQVTKEQQLDLLRTLCDCIIASVRNAGVLGKPAGHLYAELMPYGINLDQFNTITSTLCKLRKLTKRGECYHIPAA